MLADRHNHCEVTRSDVPLAEIPGIIRSLAARLEAETGEAGGFAMLGFSVLVDEGPTATVTIMRNLTHAEWRVAVASVSGPPLHQT